MPLVALPLILGFVRSPLHKTIVHYLYIKPKLFSLGRGLFKLFYRLSLIQFCAPFPGLQRLLNISHQNSGAPLFMFPTPVGLKPVTGHHFTNFLKSCIVHIVLDPTQYSPHSFRLGCYIAYQSSTMYEEPLLISI